jgi:hypothetical protein
METAERALLDETIAGAVAEACVSGGGSAAVDAALTRLGWHEMLHAEPRDAIEIVFGALGSTNATATVLDDVLVSALGIEPSADLAVLLPRYGTWAPPARVDERISSVSGLGTGRGATASTLLVVVADGEELRAATVPVGAANATVVRGIDPDVGLRVIEVDSELLGTTTQLDAHAWEAAVAIGRRAVAQQIAGASRTMLELACAHAVERVQFGRPVVRFQAVRHRLADALVAVEALDASLAAAWDAPGRETAALAKAVAGRTARTVAAHCQQVLAGIGFTTDHAFHRFLKRTMALEGLFGSADEIVVEVGKQLLASRRVPTLIEL